MSLAGSYFLRLPYTPAIAATFIVDVVDKFLKDVLDVVPYGRCWMHTLLAVALFTGLIWYWKGKAWGLSWCIGHLLHLVGDWGFVPWFYPLLSYSWPDAPNVVAVSAQGLQEAVQSLAVVTDATGTVAIQGFHFSDAVAQVFRMNLILLEFGILAPILLLMADPCPLPKSARYGLIALLSFSLFVRLLYDYPDAVHFINSHMGGWVQL